jgi:DNA-binding transcriptional MerR regulator
MGGFRISEVARRTGLSASTIRFYEGEGLIAAADRDANGYRSYGETDVQRLSFIAGAKQLDLGLAEVRQLLVAREESERCEHVQHQMHEVVARRRVETEARIAELQRVADELRRTEERLAGPATGGTCSDACACAALAGEQVPLPDGATRLTLRRR